jgi:molybdopterin-guanine dinucleotide biosynthesis protein A
MENVPQLLVTGLLLAGGQARRMGGNDKGLLPLNGRPLAAWGLERLAPQVDEVLISANRNQAQYEKFSFSCRGLCGENDCHYVRAIR